MATTDDFISHICAALDARIASNIDNLISADPSRHDRLAGAIRDVQWARKMISEEARKWRLRDDEETS